MKNKKKCNPFCKNCKIPTRKKQKLKDGELRFKCPKCGDEYD